MPTPLDWIAPAVLALRPYRHGRSIAEIARERGVSDIIKLSSNENPLGPGKSVLKILREFRLNLCPAIRIPAALLCVVRCRKN